MTGPRSQTRLLPWFEDAACAGHPEPDLWFSDEPADRARAREICAGCPVLDGCFAAAVARGEAFGTWGGRDFEGRRLGEARGRAIAGVRAGDTAATTPAGSERVEQLGLPLVLPDDPARPARWVAGYLGMPLEWVQAAIDADELPARFDGEQWQVPLWAISTVGRTAS
jgi:hypothetical protein